jgi:hypothetical protein
VLINEMSDIYSETKIIQLGLTQNDIDEQQ